jgi:hypothetical protein
METDHILNCLGVIEKTINKARYVDDGHARNHKRSLRMKRLMHAELARRYQIRSAT